MKFALGLVLAASATTAFASEDSNAAIATGVVRMAATMNEMALACKHMTASEIDNAKAKQKSAAMADLKIGASDYDKLYAEASGGFKRQWATAPAAKQKQSCDQMKNMPKNPS